MSNAWNLAMGRRARQRRRERDRRPHRVGSSAPWRDVAWIDERTGPQGGKAWELILTCGHLVFRRAVSPNPDTIRIISNSWKAGLAPKRVRCDSCGCGIPSCDPAVLISARRQRAGVEGD